MPASISKATFLNVLVIAALLEKIPQRCCAQYSGLASKAPPWYHNTPPWWLGSIPSSAMDPDKGGYVQKLALASPIVPKKSAAPAFIDNAFGISPQQIDMVSQKRADFLGVATAKDLTGSEAALKSGDMGLVPASVLALHPHEKRAKDLDSGMLWTLVNGANDAERGGSTKAGGNDAAGRSVLEMLNPGTLGPSAVLGPTKLLLFLEEQKRGKKVERAFTNAESRNRLLRAGDETKRLKMKMKTHKLGASTHGKCVFECLHKTKWGEAYDMSHQGGSIVNLSPSEDFVARKSTTPCGVQVVESMEKECSSCDSRSCIGKAAQRCRTQTSGTSCNSIWLLFEERYFDTSAMIPNHELHFQRVSAGLRGIPPYSQINPHAASFIETHKSLRSHENMESRRNSIILPLWDRYWETHMPPMMSSYAHSNRLLNYKGSALDYYYHPESYGLESKETHKEEKVELSAKAKPAYTSTDDQSW